MKRSFYPRLAIDGMRKNRRMYGPYLAFLRPMRSVNLPQHSAPRIAPSKPEEVTTSTILSSMPKSFWKKGIAPEITPVSKPNNSPPMAATIAIT